MRRGGGSRGLEDVATELAYLELMRGKTIPDNDAASFLPYRPDLKYGDKWRGWDDFLLGE